ncbi:MAG: alpha/beta fold hydrolase [Mycoplasmatales bacterium]
MKNIIINGLNINYECLGKGNDIILLHGWGQSIEAFRPTVDFLKKKYKVWSIDLPGFGMSDEPLVGMDIYEYEKLLSSFIEINNIKNPILLGHSFGGRISIIYAAKNNNINKLILTGAAGIKPKRKFSYKFKVYHYKFMKFLCNTPFYFQYKNDLLSTSGSTDYKNASPIMKETLIKVVNEDLTYLLDKIECETLLYWGERDDATPLADGVKMSDLIPNAMITIVNGYGHFAYLENFQDFNDKIDDFLA